MLGIVDVLVGAAEGSGFHTPVRGTMFFGSSGVHPDRHANATSPALLRDDQSLRKVCAIGARQRRGGAPTLHTVPSFRVTRECRSPALKLPHKILITKKSAITMLLFAENASFTHNSQKKTFFPRDVEGATCLKR